MKIISVHLEDVKSYEDASVHFTDGTNAICGRNGAGKSTILEAIGFTVFDYLQTPQASFVRKGSKTATVTVCAEKNDRQLEIVRSCGGSSKYAVYDYGTQITNGKAETVAFLHELLDIPESEDLGTVFKDAVGVPQGLLTLAFLETPANRRRTFGPLLHVDDYESAWSKLRESEKILQSKANESDVRIARLEAESGPLDLAISALSDLDANYALTKSDLSSLSSDMLVAVHKLSDMDRAAGAVDGATDVARRAAGLVALADQRLAAAVKHERESSEAKRVVLANCEAHDKYPLMLEELDSAQSAYSLAHTSKSLAEAMESKLEALAERLDALLARELAANEAESKIDGLASLVEKEKALKQDLYEASVLQRDERHAEERVISCKKRLEESQKRLAVANENYLELSGLYSRLRDMKDALRIDEELQHRLRERGLTTKSAIEALQKRIEALSESESAVCPVCEGELSPEHRDELIASAISMIEEFKAEKDELSSSWMRAKRGVEDGRAKISGVEKRIAAIEALPGAEELQSIVDADRDALCDAKRALVDYEGLGDRIEELSGLIEKLESPSSEMAVCKSLAAELPEIRKQISSFRESISDGEESLQSLLSVAEEEDYERLRVEKIRATIAELKPKYELYISMLGLSEKHEVAAAALASAEEDLRERKLEAEHAEKVLAEIREEYDEVAHGELRERVSALGAEQAVLKDRLETQSIAIESAKKHIAHFESKLEDLHAERDARKVLNVRINDLSFLRQVIRDAGPEITKMIVASVSIAADRIFCEIVQDSSASLEWTEDYDIVVSLDGQIRHFNQLSGGEQMSAALSVRLALLKEISSVDFAFFDEPTVNLDAQRRESLAAQIMNVKGFSQLFVISHDDSFEQGVDNAVRIAKGNGVSTVA